MQSSGECSRIAFAPGVSFGQPMNAEAAQVIARHELQPLPVEGGFFRRTWTSPETVPGLAGRPAATAILYLMTPEAFSALHRLDADELWSFQAGDPVIHLRLDPGTSQPQVTILGPDSFSGQVSQLVVPAGTWQAARPFPRGGNGWSLIAATMTPGWSDEGFVLGRTDELCARFPAAVGLIGQFVR